jgi:uncharacterized protein YktB (UPF0637 family)
MFTVAQNTRFDALAARMDELGRELRGEIHALGDRLERRIDSIDRRLTTHEARHEA